MLLALCDAFSRSPPTFRHLKNSGPGLFDITKGRVGGTSFTGKLLLILSFLYPTSTSRRSLVLLGQLLWADCLDVSFS